MICRKPWKIDDPVWIAEREAGWPKYFNDVRRSASEDADFDEYFECVRAYYDSGFIDPDYADMGKFIGLKMLLLLHPDRSVESIRGISEHLFCRGLDSRGYFPASLIKTLKNIFIGFIDKDFATKEELHFALEAYFGKDYYESAELLQFDPKEQANTTFRALMPMFYNWQNDTDLSSRLNPYRQFTPHLQQVFELVDEKIFEDHAFLIKNIKKFTARHKAGNYADDPVKQKQADWVVDLVLQSKLIDPVKDLFR